MEIELTNKKEDNDFESQIGKVEYTLQMFVARLIFIYLPVHLRNAFVSLNNQVIFGLFDGFHHFCSLTSEILQNNLCNLQNNLCNLPIQDFLA